MFRTLKGIKDIHGPNGCYKPHIKLRIIFLYSIQLNYMCSKYEVISMIFDCFKAFYLSQFIFAQQESLTWKMKFATSLKVSFPGKYDPDCLSQRFYLKI